MQHRLSLGPGREFGGFRVDEGIVAGNHDGDRSHVVLGVEDSEVVIGVVVISSGFAGETHASEGSELGGDMRLEVEVELNEVGRDG